MELAEGISKIGFRRWYERQLIEGHLYLVTCILSVIAVLTCIEGFSIHSDWPELCLRAGAIAGGGWTGAWSLVRYFAMLSLAGHAAERSVCRRCTAYGMLDVAGKRTGAPPGRAKFAHAPIRVRCRQCGNEWTID